jgi:hypothetical protein
MVATGTILATGTGEDTVTTTLPFTFPPGPVQEIVYVVLLIRAGVINEPEVPILPLERVHAVALADDHDTVAV